MEKILAFLKSKYKQIIPVIHFLMSFLWEKKIFLYNCEKEYWISTVRSGNVISDNLETAIVYFLSRLFSFIIICFIWKIIFYAFEKRIRKIDMAILGTVLLAGMIVGVILYPSTFGIEVDNYENFLMARRFQPTYWHSIYTGALYAGCFMVIPHPIALFIFQWLFVWFVISYIYIEIDKMGLGIVKYCSLFLLIFPESYYLIFNAYRNNYYAVLVMFYIAFIFFSIRNNSYVATIPNIIKFSGLSAFIMVWRSEGILIGAGGILVYLLYIIKVKRTNIRSLSVTLIVFAMSFGILHQIQAIGADKYYGRDYMIINTTNVLYNIFNDPNADLTYDGADSDLSDIDAVIPIEVLKEYGINGYINYNWTQGRQDFNQTLASDELSGKYMKAYYKIVLHNIKDYLSIQLNCFYRAVGLNIRHKVYSYTGENRVVLEPFRYDTCQYGKNEVESSFGTSFWSNNGVVMNLRAAISEKLLEWREHVSEPKNVYIHVGSFVLVAILFLKEVITLLSGRKSNLGFGIAFLTVMAELLAVMLFMPEGRPAYLYPMLYASYLLLFLYAINALKNRLERV